MATWEMACSCGDMMKSDGDTKEEAVDTLFRDYMTPEAIGAHMAEKHAGQPVPTPEQAREGMLATAHTV